MGDILLADDHAAFRRALRRLLEHLPHSIHEAEDTDSALAAAMEVQPVVVVVDDELAGQESPEIVRRLREAAPGSTVIVLSLHDAEPYERAARDAGAHHVLRREDVATHLLALIEAALHG
jgi:DNA-binding NarL/FixJ family response regulator